MTRAPTQAPRLEDFFESGSAWKLALRGHPYDFADTYQVLRNAYGYRSHYVNLGLWRPELVSDSDAMDPGTRLVRFLVEQSGAARGASSTSAPGSARARWICGAGSQPRASWAST